MLVRGRSVSLRRPVAEDKDAFVAALEGSRSLLHPWVDVDTDPRVIDDWLDAVDLPTVQRAFVVPTEGDQETICGVYSISQIFRGSFRGAYLGYYALEPFARQGLMRGAMPLVFRFAFDQLGLHRLQANVQPENERSLALLRTTGWREEGYAKRYLKIGGQWRDHVMFAILAEEAPRHIPRRP